MKKLINPIAHFNEYILLGIGLASVVINIVSGFYMQFKMVSILRFVQAEVGWLDVVVAALVSYGTGIMALYLYGLSINRKTRLLDIVNTVLLALIPPMGMVFLIEIPLFSQAQARVMKQPHELMFGDTVVMMLLAMAALLLLTYFIVLLYRGFKTATNLKTTTQVILFAIILFVVSTFSPYLLKL